MRLRLAFTLTLLVGLPASAVELADGKLSINGFGGWGVGFTDRNEFAIGNTLGTRQQATMSLATGARPIEQLSIFSQFFFHVGGGEEAGASLDWAFAEWHFADLFRLRVGRAKMPLGLFGELRDVGTLRPMFLLPQSIYGPSEIVTEAYQGAGATGRFESSGGWELEYDLFAGALEVPVLSPFYVLEEGRVQEAGEVPLQALGGRITVLPPLEGLKLMVSGYYGQLMPEEVLAGPEEQGELGEAVWAAGVSVEYLRGGFSGRVELFMRSEEEDETIQAGYLELAYYLTEKLQVVGRADLSATDLEWFEGHSSLLDHRDLALGVNYWFTPDFVVKLAYDNIYGNRFAFPDELLEAYTEGTIHPRTQMVSLGGQFAF